jgi:hypothetical protein
VSDIAVDAASPHHLMVVADAVETTFPKGTKGDEVPKQKLGLFRAI